MTILPSLCFLFDPAQPSLSRTTDPSLSLSKSTDPVIISQTPPTTPSKNNSLNPFRPGVLTEIALWNRSLLLLYRALKLGKAKPWKQPKAEKEYDKKTGVDLTS